MQILVAEDNSMNQRILLHLLKKLGYRADAVNNGLEVLDYIKNNSTDLIFMDIQMPEMDGIEATRILSEKLGDKRPVIIALTANDQEEHKKRYIESGMNDYMTKPIRLDVIRSMIDKYNPS